MSRTYTDFAGRLIAGRLIAGRLIAGALLSAALIVLSACGGQAPTEAAESSAPSDTAAEVLEAYRSFGGSIVALDAAAPSATVEVADLTGTIPAYDLTGGNPPCSGFIRQAPSLVFTLAADQPAVHLAFKGNQATNLVVVEEGEDINCPTLAASTVTPELTLEQPTAGRYGVWIGRIDMDKPVEGTLTVTLAK
jgi:hypothetical protein